MKRVGLVLGPSRVSFCVAVKVCSFDGWGEGDSASSLGVRWQVRWLCLCRDEQHRVATCHRMVGLSMLVWHPVCEHSHILTRLTSPPDIRKERTRLAYGVHGAGRVRWSASGYCVGLAGSCGCQCCPVLVLGTGVACVTWV